MYLNNDYTIFIRFYGPKYGTGFKLLEESPLVEGKAGRVDEDAGEDETKREEGGESGGSTYTKAL
jgi:hypothetical protein